MNYNEMTVQQKERIVHFAKQTLERAVCGEGQRAHITIDRVIRTINRYKVRGRVYVEGDEGFLGEAYHPWFHVLMESKGGPDGPFDVVEIYVNTPQDGR